MEEYWRINEKFVFTLKLMSSYMANDDEDWSDYEQAATSFQEILIFKFISEYYLSLFPAPSFSSQC